MQYTLGVRDADIQLARKSLADVVYDRIRHQIVTGVLQPGDRLMEPVLAEDLGVSRTPVREALRRLEQAELVRRNPRDLGRYVHRPAPDEIREVLGVRAVLEGYAARLAAERVAAEELDSLADLHAQAELAIDAGDTTRLVELNTQFHDGINAASRAPHCVALIDALRDRILQYRFAFLRTDESRLSSCREHLAILAALRARDADHVELLVRRHIGRIGEVLAAEQSGRGEQKDNG
jgi:DNA-binding GntR family transcriptional regulator